MLLRRALPVLLALVLLPACSSDGGQAQALPASSPQGERVTVTVGSAEPVTAEVADTDAERAVGLMRRAAVPPGTGMVFLYDQPSDGRYYMYDVQVPLTAVFAREGEVVGVVDMPPCPAGTPPQDCPTYGPGTAFDTVLETAPATLAGKVAVGDRLEVQR